MKFQHIFLDFDGTIANTSEGIVKCMNYAFDRLGKGRMEDEEICKNIGPPLPDIIKILLNENDDLTIKQAVEHFRERYSTEGWLELNLYSGMENLLKELKNDNRLLYVVTTKPQVYVEKIIKKYNMENLFRYVSGTELGLTKTKKEQQIKFMLNKFNIDIKDVVMIGDRPEDIIAAKANEIFSIAVTYGYGKEDQLKLYGCDMVAHTVDEIRNMI